MKTIILRFILISWLLSLGSWAQGQNSLVIPDTLSGTTFNLTMDEGTQVFLTGITSNTIGFNGPLLGPTLFLNKGDSIVLNVTNALDADTTTVHWHGLHVAPQNDGGPHTVIPPNSTWSPSFKVRDKAATYWYHPHLHMKTDEHVSKGAAGMILVRDAQEAALALPRTYGVNDIPLVVQTKAFDSNGQILAHSNSDSVLLVNGSRQPYLNVSAEVLRFRVLNGSSQRVLNLGLSNGQSFYVIASDGGLLESPVVMTRLRMAPGERYELLIDATGLANSNLHLRSYASELPNGIYGATFPGMGQGMTLTGYNPNPLNGTDFDILELRVGGTRPQGITSVPTTLVASQVLPLSAVQQARTLNLSPVTMGMNQLNGGFLINNTSFSMGVINQSIPFDNVETWQITNNSGIAHPFHIHDVQFYLLERNGAQPPVHERGRKDVVLVPPGQSVKFIAKFGTFYNDTLPYMYHCHMLRHEDMGMMGQFIVNSSTVGMEENVTSAPAIQLYPNPVVGGEMTLVLPKGDVWDVQLVNANGQVLRVESGKIGTLHWTLDLAPGMYWIGANSDSGQQWQKVVFE